MPIVAYEPDGEMGEGFPNMAKGFITIKPREEKSPIDISIWVIYDSPSDHPGLFVARKWVNNKPTKELITAKSLNVIRKKIPQGLTRIARTPYDDPVIVETWFGKD